jgi:zona occludens toxin (predicted ATPase)
MDVITGVPGSGKTFYLVTKLLEIKKRLEKSGKAFVIISNVEGLTLPHKELDVEMGRAVGKVHHGGRDLEALEKKIQKLRSVISDFRSDSDKFDESETGRVLVSELQKFETAYDGRERDYDAYMQMFCSDSESVVRAYFSLDYFRKTYGIKRCAESDVRHIILVYDECQSGFGTLSAIRKENQSVFYFFEKHRHLGLDIILCCQNYNAVSNRIMDLCETRKDALPRRFGAGASTFLYHEYSGRKKISTYPEKLRASKKTFGFYRSQESEQAVKSTSVFRNTLIMIVVSALLMGFVGCFFVRSMTPEKDKKIKAVENKKNNSAEAAVPESKADRFKAWNASRKSASAAASSAMPTPAPTPTPAPPKKREVVRVDCFTKSDGGVFYYNEKYKDWVAWTSYLRPAGDVDYYEIISGKIYMSKVIKEKNDEK